MKFQGFNSKNGVTTVDYIKGLWRTSRSEFPEASRMGPSAVLGLYTANWRMKNDMIKIQKQK